MNKRELGLHIDNFVKLNPKKNTRPNINKYKQNSFFIIQNSFKENKKNIITSNYDDIFYGKNSKLLGKKWIEILLSSRDIFEYHKRIRDDFSYCKPRKLIKILINDLFYLYKNNIPNILIEDSEKKYKNELKNKLEKIRHFLDEQDWSNYFFNLQKLMHEYLITFLNWKKDSFNYESYNKIITKKLIDKNFTEKEILEYLKFIQKVNLYRNALSKVKPGKESNKKIYEEWNNFSSSSKERFCWKIYFELLNFIKLTKLN